MIIRRNSKEFKAIRNLFLENAAQGKRELRLYVIQAGEGIDKRIDISDLAKTEQDFYYELNLEAVIRNLDDKSLSLHKSDDEDLYYFRDASRNWDLNPFSFKGKPEEKIEEYAKKKVKSPLRVLKTSGKAKKQESKKVTANRTHKTKLKETDKAKAIKLKLPHVSIKPEEKENTKGNREVESNPYGLKKELVFTETEQLYFPEAGFRKQDVLIYYNTISEFILPYLQERPVVFKRHTKNIESSILNPGLRELENDWKGKIPEWLESYEVYAKKYEEKVPYMLCQDREHLLFMVEAGCIEINAWHSRARNIAKPDYAVINLEPTETGFEDVVEVAQQARQVLEGLELESWLKTSGATGIHIYIPLDSLEEYTVSRELAKIICQLIHLKYPAKTSVEKLARNRVGKVFLDYFPNDTEKTIAAPYSLRANEFAGVSTPIEWDEVNHKLDPSAFTLATIKKRLDRKDDIFKGVLKKGINAKKALERLMRNYSFLIE